MWFLECDALYGDKRRWLRPGTGHLFGRTHKKPETEGQHIQTIEHPSVSRQHLLIEVANVEAGHSTHLHSKTEITVTDNSKIGTTLDHHRLSKESKVLDKNEHVLKLGNYEHVFRLKWIPVVLSFTSLSRKKDDPLTAYRTILEPLDIKCVTEYVTQYTSHVVAKKRNTSAVLQALVNGRHIVTEAFVQAIEAAAKKPSSMDESPLEVDFDANWPKEVEFLPPPGNEPNPKPEYSADFLPKEGRAELFSRYTFIFHDPSQYESLLPVVTGGGGKALLRDITTGNPNVQDMVEYVREVAGKKGDRAFRLSQQTQKKGGIVIVKVGPKIEVPGFYEQLDSLLGQHSMEQNEFLAAILDLDASMLQRSIEGGSFEQAETTKAGMTTRTTDEANYRQDTLEASPARVVQRQANNVAQQSDSAPSQSQSQSGTKRRGIRRPVAQPRFKGFDDFDPESLPKYRSPSPPQPSNDRQSQAISVDPVDARDPSQAASAQKSHRQTQQSARKPRTPNTSHDEEEIETAQDVMDGLLKGQAIMNERRKEEEKRTGKVAAKRSHEGDDAESQATPAKRPKRRKEKELDVMKAVAERREVEEEARRQDEENLREALEGMDVSEMRNLAQVEEMEIGRPDHDDEEQEIHQPDRWDDRWNGRKNFKRFRRRGKGLNDDPNVPQRPRVFVAMEEVKKKAYGLGEEYWLEPIEETKRKEREKRKQSQSQQRSQRSHANDISQNANDDDGEEDEHSTARFRRRILNSLQQDAEAARARELHPEEIGGRPGNQDIATALRATQKSRGAVGANSQLTTQSQTQLQSALPATVTTASLGTKRPAIGSDAARGPAKRRQTRLAGNVGEDSDEEDSLRFRRRR